MKIKLITVSKLSNAAVESLVTDYANRITHYSSFDLVNIKPAKMKNDSEQKKSDSEMILKKIAADDFVVLLDEKGKEMKSVEFSKWLEHRMNAATRSVCFVIGGAFGFDEIIYTRANFLFSLSKMTLPHELSKIIFTEQLYRAFSILRGEKYHHE